MALSHQEASSPNSSCSNSKRNWKFDVFLSFRGEDTRRSFTDHLYAALFKKGFRVFKDDEELERGEVISQKLLQAIEDSRFAIVVVSKNYASSSWCLDELQNILAFRKELRQEVLPIFYHVDPSDVRHQRESFAEAFAMLEDKFKEDHQKVKKWRDSLTKVANLVGWDSKDWHEAELIERVVEDLWTKLRGRLSPNSDILVGIDQRVNQLESHLKIGWNDVCFVGIWGLGGVGKTTIARAAFEKLHSQFDIGCFLANVGTISEKDGVVQLQRKLLSHLKIRNMEIEDTYEGKNIIQNLCCNKKVLLILDDVSSIVHLQNLADSPNWFGGGSRVIVTTRDLHLLKAHRVHEVYEVKTMPKDESLQLFSEKAFKRDKPQEDFSELSKSVCDYAGGLPLALCVLGSFFSGRSVLEWEDALDMLKKDPNKDIFKILRMSYDALSYTEQTIFLDIACFFNGWRKNEVTQILKSCGFNSTIGISTLIEKSLLKDRDDYLDMHDLLEQMGKSIVLEESHDDAGKRTRLWSKEDIDEVLEKNMGTKVVQGIFSSLSSEACWNPDAFSSMCNLRLLIISSDLNLPYGLQCLSSALKVLRWTKFPLDTLPLGTQLNRLVDLEMRHSKLKQLWNESQCLKNLKFLSLSHSKYLIKTPKFSELPNLEKLELEDCENIVELHSSLWQLKKLHVLNLNGCKNLKALPTKLEIRSLKKFVLHGCVQVRNLPEFGESMKNLAMLDVGETNVVKLPKSLGLLTSLEVLNLRGCKNLTTLPIKLEMASLNEFVLSGCVQVRNLPEFGENMKNLVTLDAGETSLVKLPESLGLLTSLEVLNLRGCKNLKALPIKLEMNSLKEFVLCGCIQVRNLPEFGENMKNLVMLDAGETSLVELPVSLELLTGIRVLNLRACKNLKALPLKLEIASLKELILCGCIQVRNLPEFGENMKNLVTLDVGETSLVKLPESLGLLTSLETLKLKGCKNLVCLPQSILNLKHLVLLDISGCSKFSSLPENLNEIEALEELDVSGTAIIEVPSSIGFLENLKTMSFHGCKRPMSNSRSLALPLINRMFQRHSFHEGLLLPASIFNLKSLTELDLSYCNIDDGFAPGDLSGLSSLSKLDLSGNMFVNLPAGISNLLNLRFLCLNSCSRLRSLPLSLPNLYAMDVAECASLETLSDEQLLHLFALVDQANVTWNDWKIRVLGVSILGNEIPSWFGNQIDLCLNEKGEASIIIDIPLCEEWLGIGLCTVLDDDMLYSYNKEILDSPCWHFNFVRAYDGEFEQMDGRCRYLEREIKSPHLWIVFWKFKEEINNELSARKYNKICLRFQTRHVEIIKLDREVLVKCGWRFMCKCDLEKWHKSKSQCHLTLLEQHRDEENTMCSVVEEHGQCSLLLSENTQTTINEHESIPPETSSSCSEEEGVLDDSWKQFIAEDARFWF